MATRPGVYEACDALLTSVPGVYLTVSIADCAPIFLYDPEKRVVGCVHAGWRGTGQQIVSASVERMKTEYNTSPTDVLAYVGPCAGSCCYEVGENVAGLFAEDLRSSRNGKTYLDMKKAIAAQLRSAGVPDSNVEVSSDCTVCGNEFYHSFRRDRDRSGRMVAFIGMVH
jgi:YfiH family protein